MICVQCVLGTFKTDACTVLQINTHSNHSEHILWQDMLDISKIINNTETNDTSYQSPSSQSQRMHCCHGMIHPNASTTPLQEWGFRQCLPFSWTTLRDKHCWHTPPLRRDLMKILMRKPRHASALSLECTDFKNVIFEKIPWAPSEVAEVAEVKQPQNSK